MEVLIRPSVFSHEWKSLTSKQEWGRQTLENLLKIASSQIKPNLEKSGKEKQW